MRNIKDKNKTENKDSVKKEINLHDSPKEDDSNETKGMVFYFIHTLRLL